jgi:hypothetical protein
MGMVLRYRNLVATSLCGSPRNLLRRDNAFFTFVTCVCF